ncbi:MAG: holo-ACP synthase [Betaproteobacteria bacterium]|nr:holo-ACP synthase [Rhodocyclaceae bacterium]MCA3134977.1 holo-ACP synthase [Rhodocyclaceae bacterium]MCA3143760.1 holo-ACP synthase [Rhodocyclaceae bacterium]MCA3147087.1 holo-ACP synthase [Rhodocyclaceae bacterium]MCE2898052.1 holo-ACP synthase [Betaproteobacteria bacterium]
MIHGIGVDVVLTQRVASVLERHGERFARRVLCEAEWRDFEDAADPGVFLAKRFAAKEAFGKALGTGVRAPATLHALWVVRDALGKPAFRFTDSLSRWMAERGIHHHHLSLSDEQGVAVAMVVLESGAAQT